MMTASTSASNRTTGLPDAGVRFLSVDTLRPVVALLSNGRYRVMITAAGAGYGMWRDLDVTRWREDGVRDCWGQFCYVRDLSERNSWSVGHQPLCRAADDYEAVLYPWRANFCRQAGDLQTRLAVCVSQDHDAEVRMVTVVNHGKRPRHLDVTSYAEVCLNHRRADQAHPAFAKLFLETEYVSTAGALLCRRRPRTAEQKPVWAVHVSAAEGRVEYETDRALFLGRGRTPANPAALDSDGTLSGTTGPVLDPVFSLRRSFPLAPGAEARVAFVTGAADSREEAIALAEQFQTLAAAERAFERARDGCQDELRDLGLTPEDVASFNRLAGAVLFTDPALRSADAVRANRLGQPHLWPFAISGDRPIVLARLGAVDDDALVRQLVQWHDYVRRRGMDPDLVILDERPREAVDRLLSALQSGPAGSLLGKPGGVFVLPASTVPDDGRVLIEAAARAVLWGNRGLLSEQVRHEPVTPALPPELAATALPAPAALPPANAPPEELVFWNGLGGFTRDGHEYVIVIDGTAPDGPRLPPAPWINVLTNPVAGCLVTEAGLGYTWVGNSQMHRLTPWSNDPISDPPGEAVYLRDEVTGQYWTLTPLPCGAGATVTARHGQGYTRYLRESHGLEQELLLLVPPDDPVKLARLTVRNTSDRPRRLTATYYAEWVLGTIRDNAPLQVVCEYDAQAGAVFARTAWGGSFAGRLAFLGVGTRPHSFTSDRAEFLGRHGSPAAPAALRRVGLTSRVGATLDPCAAIMTEITLPPGQTEEVVFALGQVDGLDELRRIVRSYTAPSQSAQVLAALRTKWDGILNAIRVRTPDPAIDLLVNRWLLYQVLACRVWARSAFYQSGGAYGFRDQLQDVMALVYGAPEETRAQILRSAARQFEEGDVQHWWHPPGGAGSALASPMTCSSCHWSHTTTSL
jgi:cellobiose phosphorylase